VSELIVQHQPLASVARVVSVTPITNKQELSRWTRAHADAPGINWLVERGPGGTMIIAEFEADRSVTSVTGDRR
jgi:hypothetical protein